jgi:hypothetical protein
VAGRGQLGQPATRRGTSWQDDEILAVYQVDEPVLLADPPCYAPAGMWRSYSDLPIPATGSRSALGKRTLHAGCRMPERWRTGPGRRRVR